MQMFSWNFENPSSHLVVKNKQSFFTVYRWFLVEVFYIGHNSIKKREIIVSRWYHTKEKLQSAINMKFEQFSSSEDNTGCSVTLPCLQSIQLETDYHQLNNRHANRSLASKRSTDWLTGTLINSHTIISLVNKQPPQLLLSKQMAWLMWWKENETRENGGSGQHRL